jgi:hypothetical protein
METPESTPNPCQAQLAAQRTLYRVIAVFCLAVGFLGGYLCAREFRGTTPATAAAAKGPDVPLPPELVRLASGWKCNCGNCKDLLLDCVCAHPRGAIEVKRFMLDLHTAGISLEEIRQKVSEKYGTVVAAQALRP